MIREPKPALLRVRLPTRVMTRLHELAAERNTDISELARQALFEKYPELRESSATTVVSEAPTSYSGGIPPLIDAIRAQTEVMRRLLERSEDQSKLRLLQPAADEADLASGHKSKRKRGA